MLGLAVLVMGVCAGGVLAQTPTPCIVPSEFTGRCSQLDQETNQINRYVLAYDATNQRRVFIEEQGAITPGRQFLEHLVLARQGVMYEINLTLKTCTKVPLKRPWRPYGIPPNATFENEFYMGGPGETVFAQEWSDRVPLRSREFWIGVFSLQNCYPIREVLFADYRLLNSTITTSFYDLVEGIVDPNIFIPPAECQQAPWGRPSRMGPFM